MIANSRKEFIGAHVTPQLKQQLRAKALENGMSVSEYVYLLLLKYHSAEVQPNVDANAGH